ncbi:MAG: hypothetical protein HQK53_14300 [Oligoflexia bacterium]|nr:hypothetical protein [Oligoflexia bacterium]
MKRCSNSADPIKCQDIFFYQFSQSGVTAAQTDLVQKVRVGGLELANDRGNEKREFKIDFSSSGSISVSSKYSFGIRLGDGFAELKPISFYRASSTLNYDPTTLPQKASWSIQDSTEPNRNPSN